VAKINETSLIPSTNDESEERDQRQTWNHSL